MDKHTPGPWSINYGGDTGIYGVDGYGVIGGNAFSRRPHPEAWENLRLASAAPDLLKALKAAMAFIDSHVADPDITEEMVRAYAELQAANPMAAIAKATGDNP